MLFGYAMAGVCAFVWSAYSLSIAAFCRGADNRRDMVLRGHFGAFAGLPSSRWKRPCCRRAPGNGWPVLGLGLMPVGAAFYAWDHGVKHGNIQVLGAASYAAPLLSTLVLIATGFAEPSLSMLAACLLITAGAVLAGEVAAVRPLRRAGRGWRLMLFPGGIDGTANGTLILSAWRGGHLCASSSTRGRRLPEAR